MFCVRCVRLRDQRLTRSLPLTVQPPGSLRMTHCGSRATYHERKLGEVPIMSTRSHSKAFELPDIPQLSSEERRLVAVWKEVSCIVHRLRLSDVPTSSNGMLREYIRLETKGVLSPLFQLWIGDNYQFAGQLREAIAVYRELAERFGERKFCGQAFGALGLEQAANCYERLGQTEEAISTLQEVLRKFSGTYYPGWIWFRIGQIAE